MTVKIAGSNKLFAHILETARNGFVAYLLYRLGLNVLSLILNNLLFTEVRFGVFTAWTVRIVVLSLPNVGTDIETTTQSRTLEDYNVPFVNSPYCFSKTHRHHAI
jgi:hypothetical protein